jgi:hypothetical protein
MFYMVVSLENLSLQKISVKLILKIRMFAVYKVNIKINWRNDRNE